MVIPKEHKRTIKALVKADPEVAQATCDIPHLDPSVFLRKTPGGKFPYCGCFVGVYAWMQECKRGNEPPSWTFAEVISDITEIGINAIGDLARWCATPPKDREAVRYARGLLEERRRRVLNG